MLGHIFVALIAIIVTLIIVYVVHEYYEGHEHKHGDYALHAHTHDDRYVNYTDEDWNSVKSLLRKPDPAVGKTSGQGKAVASVATGRPGFGQSHRRTTQTAAVRRSRSLG